MRGVQGAGAEVLAERALLVAGQVLAGHAGLVLLRALPAEQREPVLRGLHWSTFQLNLSALCGIGGARRDCVARVKGVLGGV
jgi:hypothetical protein